MYLKAIELQGFKSFPDKTALNFGAGVTAIVGPNGSGKSNISDAVRWVLGEQSSRALRGGKMEDVIFGGTEKRPQVGFAEVSLIIDNTREVLPLEHQEVMITRRYYRSGESEYYINRNSVRLKDIHELFMDTGLGREGYSIIGQGRIDEILSVRSENRREIFEEAAGISRYRHRKEESERKLSATDENLVRINDKIAELTLQVEPLKEQSEKAHKFLLLRDELRITEVNVWIDAIDKIKAGAIKLSHDYEAALRQSKQENEELDGLYMQAETLSEKMREKDAEAEALRAALSELEALIAECDSAEAVLNAELRHNTENIDRVTGEITEGEGRAGSMTEQIEQRRARIGALKQELETARGELDGLLDEARRASADTQDIIGRVDAMRADEGQKLSALSELKAELSSLTASAQELLDRDEAARRELAAARGELSGLEADKKELDAKLAETGEQAESLKNIIEGYSLRVKSREKRALELKERVSALKMERGGAGSRLNVLSEMEKEYGGYTKAVKTVMQEAARGSLKNIHGPVSVLIKTDARHTAAIETAMGAYLQNIVVDSEEDGKAAISLLKRGDGGRATFLPISAIKGSELDIEGVAREDGFIGIASRLVSFDAVYTGIIRNILGRTVVVTDMDSAIAMARKYSYRFRIVTADGQIISQGGAMTGGSLNRDAGILSRRNEIERLAGVLKELDEKIDAAGKELTKAEREYSAASYELDVARGQQRTLEDELLKLEARIINHKALEDSLNSKLASYNNELGAIGERLALNAGRTEEVNAAIKRGESGLEAIRSDLAKLSEGQAELTRKSGGLADRTGDSRARSAALESELAACEASLSELLDLFSEISGGHEKKLGIIDEYKGKNREIELRLTKKREERDQLNKRCEEKRRGLRDLNDEKLKIEASRVQAERDSKEKNKELLEFSREVARLEQKKAANDFEEQQLLDKLWETYALSHSAAKALCTPMASIPKAKQRIVELKRGIAELGSVNIGAIDEYKRVSERYDFLTGQRDDVEKAKGELERIIGDITREMRNIFAEQFDIINRSFGETFLEIFGGGKAELELLDRDDILNCGIEIHVQPPGKSLKTITLLSGGEKAFVAIALYFAILKVRPTPFCVLDEIEAALDDVNVSRFAAYLRRLSGSTQFIVITHRRGTMEEADVLYGVTMPEQGISKMLTINLNDAERKLNIKLD